MVKERTDIEYECEICGKRYWKKEEAEKCETKSDTKYVLPLNDQHRNYSWKVGDFILLFPKLGEFNLCFNRPVPRLAKIVGETSSNHEIYPLLEFLESKSYKVESLRRAQKYSKACWAHVVPFNDDIKNMLEEWLEKLNDK